MLCISVQAQTTLVNPATNGGFESGSTLAANGWSAVNGSTNTWNVGTATFASGANSAYISNTSGSTYAYANGTSNISHFYRDIAFPSGETKITLSFKLKGDGDIFSGTYYDKLMVYVAPTSFTPTTIDPASSTTALAGATLVYAQAANYGSGYTTVTVFLPSSLAGTTSRLLFTWHNDGSAGTVPASVDDISLTSQLPGNFVSIASGNWTNPTTWDVAMVPTAADNVTVTTTHTVTIDAVSQAANNLTINGTLTYSSTPTAFTINGNAIVSASGTFNVFNGTTGKTLNVAGNITNDGVIDLSKTSALLNINGSSLQTVGGTGSLVSNLIASLTFNNSAASPIINWNWVNTIISGPGTLTFTKGWVNLGASNKMTLGTALTSGNTGSLTYASGGFTSGIFSRWWTSAQTGSAISAGTDPTNGTSRYPFVNAAGLNRAAYVQRVSPTAGGQISCKYIDASTTSTAAIADGTLTVDKRYDGNWTFSTEGTSPAAATHVAVLLAPGSYVPLNGNSRVVGASAIAGGTHQNGTTTPGAQRVGLTLAQLTSGALYIGAANADLAQPCVTPISQPTSLVLGGVTASVINGTFTAASPTVTSYLVVRTNGSAPSAPVDGTTYTAATAALGGTIVSVGTSTTIANTGLTGNTNYAYYIYSFNNTGCTGGPLYYTVAPLTSSATTCPSTPGTATVSGLSSSAFDLTWGSSVGGAANAVTYTLDVSTVSSFTSVVAGSPFVVSTNSASVSGLTNSTQYFYRIKSSTSVCTSAYTSTVSVTTLGLPCTTPVSQPTSLILGGVTASAINGTFTAATPTVTSYLIVRTNGAIPSTPVDGTTYTVATAALGGTIVSIGSGTTIANTGLTGNTNYAYYIYSFNNTGCTGGPLYYTVAPLTASVTTCPSTPGTATVSGLSQVAFNLNWGSSFGGGANAVTYTLDVSTVNTFTSVIVGSPFVVSTNSVSILGLTANTQYFYRIMASNGCTTVYTSTASVTTPCNAITSLPWTEGFEGITPVGAGILPSCWSYLNIAGANPPGTFGSDTYRTPRTGTNLLYSQYSNTARVFTPGFQLTSGISYDFSFYMKNYNALTPFTMDVAYGSSPTEVAMTNTLLAAYSATNSAYTLFKYTIVPTTTGTYYFGVKSTSPNTTPWYMSFDDFTLEITPTCYPPTALTTTSITTSAVNIGWTAPSLGSPALYQYEVRTSGAAGSGTTGIAATGTLTAPATSVAISGLYSSTNYSAYIRTNCGGSDNSAWSAVATFSTTALTVDLQALLLQAPVLNSLSCYGNVPVVVQVKNLGTTTLDFSSNNAGVITNITGPNPQSYTNTISSGTLAANATLNVTVTASYNMSAFGTYTFNVNATLATPDLNPLNNSIAAVTYTNVVPTALPILNGFTGFTGSNLSTAFPLWIEAAGSSVPTGSTSAWVSQTGLNGAGNITAKINLFSNTANEWIIAPKFTVATGVSMKFDAAVTDYASLSADPSGMTGTDDKLDVMISTDCGTSFTSLLTITQTNSLTLAFKTFSVNLSAYAGQDVIVGFRASEGTINDLPDYDLHLDNINIVIIPSDPPTPVQSTVAPTCANGTGISVPGTPAAGTAWYWQTIPTGTLTSTPVSGNYTVYVNGSYYVRAYNAVNNTWSVNSSSVVIANMPVAPLPPNPSVGASSACLSTTLSVAAPTNTNITYYWQGTNAIGTSTASNAATAYTATATGTYYVAAYDASTSCWSATNGASVTIQTVVPSAPTTAISSLSVCQGAVSATIAAQTPASATKTVTLGSAVSLPGSGNAILTQTISIPAGVTIVSTNLLFNGVTTTALTYPNDIKATLSGAINMTATTISTVAAVVTNAGPYTLATPAISASGGVVTLTLTNGYSGAASFANVSLVYSYTVAPSSIIWWDAPLAGVQQSTVNPLETVGTTVLPNTSTIGTYTFYAESVSGVCPSSSRLPITVSVISPPSAPLTANSSQCGFAVPTASVSGGSVYNWYNAASAGTLLQSGASQTYTTSISNTTTFYVAISNGICNGPRAAVTASVTTPDAVTANATSTSVCLGVSSNTVTLTAVQTGTNNNNYSFTWTSSSPANSGMSTPVSGTVALVTTTIAGSYTYSLTAVDGVCTSVSTIMVGFNTLPLIVSSASPTVVCSGNVVNLNANTASAGTTTLGAGLSATSGSGSGSTISPFSHYFGGERIQYLIHANELTAAGLSAGNITALGLNVVSAGTAYSGFAISIGATAQSVATTTFVNTLSQVYSNPSVTPVVGVNTYNFSTPFNWDGTSNVVVQMCWTNNNTGGSAAEVKTDVMSYVSTSGAFVDNSSAMCTHTAVGGTASARPQFIFSGSLTTPGNGGLTWQWNPGAISGNTTTVNPINTGTTATTSIYTVTATNTITTCSNTATVGVLVNPLPIALSVSGSTQCGYGIPTASVTGTGATYKWYDAATAGNLLQSGASVTYTSPINATTTFYVSQFNGICEGPRTAVTATVTTPDAVVASISSSTICLNNTVTLMATTTGTTNVYNYTWTGAPVAGSGMPTSATGASAAITPSLAGTYVYTLIGNDGSCTAINTVSLTVNGLPSIISSISPTVICSAATVTLNATTNVIVAGLRAVGTNSVADYIGGPYREGSGSDNKVQYLFTAAELNAAGIFAGNITSATFSVTSVGTGTMSNFTLRMGATISTSISTTYDAAPATVVYGPVSYKTVVGNNLHTFTTPFNWDGISNVILQVCHDAVTAGSSSAISRQSITNRTAYTNATSACASTSGTSLAYRAVITLAGQVSGQGAGSLTWQWNPGAISGNTATTTPINTGTVATTIVYTVTGTNPVTSCSNTSTVSVLVNPVPVALVAHNSAQCGYGVPTASVTGMGGTYKWYNAVTSGTLVQSGSSATYTSAINATTTFYVAENNGNCEGPLTAVTVSVTTPDAITAAVSTSSICPNTLVTLTASNTGTTNVYTYTWTASPAAGSGIATSVSGTTAAITPSVSGNYVYTVVGSDAGCAAIATISLNVIAPPTIITSATPSIICSGTAINLNAGVMGVGPGMVNLGSGTSTTTGSGVSGGNYVSPFSHYFGGYKGQYLVRASELTTAGVSAGNLTSLALNVTSIGTTYTDFAINMAATAQSVMTTTFVAGLTQVYPTSNHTPVVGVNTYNFSTPFNWNGTDNIVVQICWSNNNGGGTASEVKYDSPGYTAMAYYRADNQTSAALCGQTSASGTVGSRPQFIFGGLVNSPVSGAITWQWNPGAVMSNTMVVNPTNTGATPTTPAYTVTAIDPATTCSNTAVVTVTVNPVPNVTATTANSVVCLGSSATLNAGGATTYTWAPQGGQFATTVVTPTATTIYTVSATSFGCNNTATVQIVSVSIPTVTAVASSTTALCAGSAVVLSASGTATSYSWVPAGGSAATTTVMPSSTTIYTVTGSNGSCSAKTTVSVNVIANPVVIATSSRTLICTNESAVLTASTSATSYTWSTNAASATTMSVTVTPTVATNYTVTVSNGTCTATATVSVNVNPCTGVKEVYASNGISIYPNPTNGIVHIAVTNELLENATIELYDAIGKLVIREVLSKETTTVNMNKLEDGVYFYKVISNNQDVKIGKLVKQ